MDLSLHSAVLTLFVAGGVAWIATVVSVELLGQRMQQRGDLASVTAFAADHAWLTRVVAIPAALIALVSGVWLIRDGDLDVSASWWVGAVVGIWIVSFLLSTMQRGVQLGSVVRAADALAPEDDDEEVRWRIRQVLLVTRGELLLLAVALVLMVVRPS